MTQSAVGQAPAPRADSDFKVLQRLRQACRTSLERYIDVASHSSGHLAQLTPGAVDQLGRMNLTLLRQKENKAHQAYLDARSALLEFILEKDKTASAETPAS